MNREAVDAITSGQVGLFDDADKSIERRFAEFDAENPIIFETLMRLALARLDEGRTHYGIEAIFADLRWEFRQTWDSNRGFKLNDHFTSRYVRKLMRDEPRLEGFFEIRKLRAR